MSEESITLFGSWEEAAALLGAYATQLPKALDQAIMHEGEECRADIVEGMVAQAPGGQPFKPLAQSTIAFRRAKAAAGVIAAGKKRIAKARAAQTGRMIGAIRAAREKLTQARNAGMGGTRKLMQQGKIERRFKSARAQAAMAKKINAINAKTSWRAISKGMKVGTKALINHGDLIGNIRHVHKRGTSFVGILRSTKGSGTKPLVNIAAIHEYGFGPFAVKMTPKQRRWLAMMYRTTGLPPKTGKGGGGTVTIRIPARPYLRPVFRMRYGDKSAATARIMALVRANLGV